MTTAYVYKWTHLPTMKWYNGSISKKFIPGTEPDGFVSGRIITKRKLVATELNVQVQEGKA